MKAFNIIWDTDDNEDIAHLPNEIEIPETVNLSEDAISDYLSDTTGFCHCGFGLKDNAGNLYSTYELELLQDIKDYLIFEEENSLSYPFEKKWETYTDDEKFLMVRLLEDGYEGVEYDTDDIYDVISRAQWADSFDLALCSDARDICLYFKLLQKRAKELGLNICLHADSDVPLVLYVNEDYPDKVLVDKCCSEHEV